jgi:hypothetical protein
VPFVPPFFNPDHLTPVPGVVGRITDWETVSALYPNRPLSVGSALVTVGTLMGRRVIGPTQAGHHLYVVLVAQSADGKQQPLDCLKDLLAAAGCASFICSDIKSSPALVEMLKDHPVLCAVIDEYGQVLARVLRSNAGGSETDLLSVMRQLWGLGFGKQYHTPAALHRPTDLIYGPAFSVLASTTPDDLGGVFTSKQIAGGYFNRHLKIVGKERPSKQDRPEGSWKVPPLLAEMVRALRPPLPIDDILKRKVSEVKDPKEKRPPQPITPQVELRWGSGAKAIWDELDSFARVAEMTVRIAGIVAYGRGSLTIEVPDMEWAQALAMRSAQEMYEAVQKYLEDPKTHNALCNYILESVPKAGVVHYLLRRDGRKYLRKGGDFDAAVNDLLISNQIHTEHRQTAGKTALVYVAGPKPE